MLKTLQVLSVVGAIGGLPTVPAWANDSLAPSHDPAAVLPKNTALAILLDTRPTTWQQMEQYALFQILNEESGVSLNLGGALAFLPPELDYTTDIAPWVADTIAFTQLPLVRPQAVALENYQVAIAPIARPENFDGFIAAVTEARGSEPSTQSYQTLEFLYWEPQFIEEVEENAYPNDSLQGRGWQPTEAFLKALPNEEEPIIPLPAEDIPDVPGLAIAVLPGYIVTASTPEALQRWWDLRPTDPTESLAKEPRFQDVLAYPQYDKALGTLYGNLSELVKYSLVSFDLPTLPIPFPVPRLPEAISPEEAAQLASTQLDGTVEVLLYPQREGLRLQGRLYYGNSLLNLIPPTEATGAETVLSFVPSATYFMLSGRNLAGGWAQITKFIEASEETRPFLDQLRTGFLLFTGLDLDKELFGWMDQGFSIFLFPTRKTPLTLILPDLHVGLGFVVQTSDRPAAELALAKLDENLGALFTVEPFVVNGQPASNWRWNPEDSQTSFLGHGWANDNTWAITSSAGSLTDVLNLSARQNLSGSSIFRRATQGFAVPNQGYFYTNLSATFSLVFNLFPSIVESSEPLESLDQQDWAKFRRVLSTVQTASTTLSSTEEYFQVDGLLMLSPAAP